MLFLVGLELEPKRLWSLRRPIFGWGSAQVLGCAGVLFLVGVAGRRELARGAGRGAGPGAVLDRDRAAGAGRAQPAAHRPSGQAGFSILLFQDVAAIPILALLPLLAVGAGTGADITGADRALEGLKIVAVIGGIVLGGRLAAAARCCAGSRAATRPRSSPPPRCCWWSRSRR